jgi:hypothetical protein
MLSLLIRREKLGIDPTLQATALDCEEVHERLWALSVFDHPRCDAPPHL